MTLFTSPMRSTPLPGLVMRKGGGLGGWVMTRSPLGARASWGVGFPIAVRVRIEYRDLFDGQDTTLFILLPLGHGDQRRGAG